MARVSSRSIFVSNLSSKCREKDLQGEFHKFGEIKRVEINPHKGHAFIRFYESDDAKKAVNDMDGKDFDGAKIRVDFKSKLYLLFIY